MRTSYILINLSLRLHKASPRDGTSLAGAVLEAMAKAGHSGFFATHLHDIFSLPLEFNERVVPKTLALQEVGVEGEDNAEYKWTYRLTDGVCMDSMALVTAAQFGLPDSVLARAEALSTHLPSDHASANFGTNKPFSEMDARKERASKEHLTKNEKGQKYDMDSVIELVLSLSGQVPFSIPPTWCPPAALAGQSCVYVLRLNSDKGPQYYVGETDSFQQRLRQHRAKRGDWSSVDCVAFPVASGKSEARAIENLLIKKLASEGYPLKSSFDGRTTRTSRQNYSG